MLVISQSLLITLLMLYSIKQESAETDNVNAEEDDPSQVQTPPLSPTPSASTNPDTRQSEGPAMYDTPGRTAAADIMRQFGVVEGVMQRGGDLESHQGGGLDGGGDRRTETPAEGAVR